MKQKKAQWVKGKDELLQNLNHENQLLEVK